MSFVELIDCTLRDGSYPLHFGFTEEHTGYLVARLEAARIRRIEVGHGLGLGATRRDGIAAGATDRAYMRAARSAAKRAKVGVFTFPRYETTLDDFALAADHGMDFVRVGVDAVNYLTAEAHVRRAVETGFHTTLFLMKTYTIGFDALAEAVPIFRDWGTDAIAIVDSAGGMTPGQVRGCVEVLKETGQEIAFHGHNNLQLAVGNALAAVEAGATAIDASLRGIGRSAGNAHIESLAVALPKAGFEVAPDAVALGRLAEEFLPTLGPDADVHLGFIELMQGMAGVHSGTQAMINRTAEAYGVDVAELMLAAGSERDGLDVDEPTMKQLAERLALKAAVG